MTPPRVLRTNEQDVDVFYGSPPADSDGRHTGSGRSQGDVQSLERPKSNHDPRLAINILGMRASSWDLLTLPEEKSLDSLEAVKTMSCAADSGDAY